ncbi:hypothetical protein LCGC14_2860670, partial [marine sediment metagenome]
KRVKTGFVEAEIWTFAQDPEDEIDECEKCGEEVGRRLIGDEWYRNCPDCGMAIEQ